jgi:hypothetical protein
MLEDRFDILEDDGASDRATTLSFGVDTVEVGWTYAKIIVRNFQLITGKEQDAHTIFSVKHHQTRGTQTIAS